MKLTRICESCGKKFKIWPYRAKEARYCSRQCHGKAKLNQRSLRRLNLIGKKFGRLTVIRELGSRKGRALWLCECDCGKKTEALTYYLTGGETKSCGCLKADVHTTHGLSRTRFYNIWKKMKERCSNKKQSEYKNQKHNKYKYYGAKGVKVCERWQKFENFRDDMYESYKKHVKDYGVKQTTIERNNPYGNYELSNRKWATLIE